MSKGTPKRKKSVVREYIEAIVVAVVLALVIRHFIVQGFRISSDSMEDTLLVDDFLLANRFIYGPKIPFTDIRLPGIRKPKTGDIILFKHRKHLRKPHAKKRGLFSASSLPAGRVIGVEGQRVEIRDKVVYVDGERLPFPPKSKFTDRRILPRAISPRRDNYGPVTVPKDALFVMGDNRDNSQDSRYWGFLPMKNVEGKTMILYWSWNSEVPLWDISRKVRWGRLGDLVH